MRALKLRCPCLGSLYPIGYLPRLQQRIEAVWGGAGRCGASGAYSFHFWLHVNFVCQFPGLRLPKSYRQFLGAVPLTLQILFSMRSRPVTYLHLCGLR
jgi:hypothetical protein